MFPIVLETREHAPKFVKMQWKSLEIPWNFNGTPGKSYGSSKEIHGISMEILRKATVHATEILKLLISLDILKIYYRMPLKSLEYSSF